MEPDLESSAFPEKLTSIKDKELSQLDCTFKIYWPVPWVSSGFLWKTSILPFIEK